MDEPFARGPDGRSTDLPSGGGVPSWLADSLNFCSRCGSSLVFGTVPGEDRERLVVVLFEEAVQPDQRDSLLACPPLELRREAAGEDG